MGRINEKRGVGRGESWFMVGAAGWRVLDWLTGRLRNAGRDEGRVR